MKLLFFSLLLFSWALMAILAADNKRSCVTGRHMFPAPSYDNNGVVSSKTTLKAKHGVPDRFLVHWKTSIGNNNNDNNTVVTVEIIREWSPIGVDRFYQLVLDNFYNCATFFRVVPNFIVQFGIAADPEETAKWDVAIADDDINTSNIQSNTAGTLTYATAGADTRTSQLFVNLQDNAHLDKQGFTPFGRVVTGMGALHRVYNPTPGSSGGIDQEDLMDKGNDWVLQEYPQMDLIWETELEIPFPQENAGPETGGNEDEVSEEENGDEVIEDENHDEALEILNDDRVFKNGNDDGNFEDLNDNKAYKDENNDNEDYEGENDGTEDESDDDDYENEDDDEDFEDENFYDENDNDYGTMENEKSAFDFSESYNSFGGESGLDAYSSSFANEKSKMNNNDDSDEDEMNSGDDEMLFGDDNVEEFVETSFKGEQKNRIWIVLAVILEVALLLCCSM